MPDGAFSSASRAASFGPACVSFIVSPVALHVMKIFVIIAVSCSMGFPAQAQLETNLLRQMHAWRKGDAAPAQLLKFPDGKLDRMPGCGLRVIGSEVGDYIWEIQNPDLLATLMFDYRAQADTIHAAASRLITLKGVGYVSRLLAQQRKAEPDAFTRSELAVLSQLLHAPYITIQVAHIARKDLPTDQAESALQAMRTDLQAGMPWADAYRKHSNLHPESRAKAARGGGALIGYLYDGTVSESGFDILTYSTAGSLPAEHLRELFRTKRGTQIYRGTDGVYLYHVRSYYNDEG
jgi:hypothetical protein